MVRGAPANDLHAKNISVELRRCGGVCGTQSDVVDAGIATADGTFYWRFTGRLQLVRNAGAVHGLLQILRYDLIGRIEVNVNGLLYHVCLLLMESRPEFL